MVGVSAVPAPRRATSGAAALLAALAGIDPDATGLCALCEIPVRLGQLRPLAPGLPGVVVCPGCAKVLGPTPRRPPPEAEAR